MPVYSELKIRDNPCCFHLLTFRIRKKKIPRRPEFSGLCRKDSCYGGIMENGAEA